MKKQLLFFFFLSFTFFACKKEDTTTTNNSGFNLPQGGYIRGTITGSRADGTPLDLDFNHPYYYGGDYLRDGILDFYRDGSPNFLTEIGSSSIALNLSAGLQVTPTIDYFRIDILSPLSSGETLNFNSNFYGSGTGGSAFITDYAYDTLSRIATGKFIILTDPNNTSTGYSNTITGEFQTNPIQTLVNRIRK